MNTVPKHRLTDQQIENIAILEAGIHASLKSSGKQRDKVLSAMDPQTRKVVEDADRNFTERTRRRGGAR